MAGDTGTLGYFNTRLDSIQGLNYISTATTDVFSLPSNITIMCDDNGDAIGAESAVLLVLGKFLILFVLYSWGENSLIPGNFGYHNTLCVLINLL